VEFAGIQSKISKKITSKVISKALPEWFMGASETL